MFHSSLSVALLGAVLAAAAVVPSCQGNTTRSTTSSSSKLVFAHFMVANSNGYSASDWATDFSAATAAGIDAFALNIGQEPFYATQVAAAYNAAKGTNIKLFLSFDMTSLPCAAPGDAAGLLSYINTYGSHPNQLIYNGAIFASTFAGDQCKFGQSSAPAGWKSQFINGAGSKKIYFVPAIFVDPATFSAWDGVINGAFNWNGGWPIGLTTPAANSDLASVGASVPDNLTPAGQTVLSAFASNVDSDKGYFSGLKSIPSGAGSYMAAVSPWFFTHYSPQSFNKNWIYLSDYHLYPSRWDALIQNRDNVDFVEVVTWNDYGESHYIGPIHGTQPGSNAWVDGFDHQGWLKMTSYYAQAFKTGTPPAITKDQIFLWSRPHPKEATANDPIGKPTTWEVTLDAVWAVVMTTAPSTVTLSTTGSDAKTFNVPAGVTKLSIPIAAGGTMKGSISRNGATVASVQPSFTFNGSPANYNFNAFVAASN